MIIIRKPLVGAVLTAAVLGFVIPGAVRAADIFVMSAGAAK